MMEIFSADGWLNTTIVSFNDFFWSYILVAGLMVHMEDSFRAVSYGW